MQSIVLKKSLKVLAKCRNVGFSLVQLLQEMNSSLCKIELIFSKLSQLGVENFSNYNRAYVEATSSCGDDSVTSEGHEDLLEFMYTGQSTGPPRLADYIR